MKKAAFLLPVLLFCVVPLLGQVEHAPTPEVCRADADAWSVPQWSLLARNEANFDNYAVLMSRDPNVSAKTMEGRRNEMMTCIKTDRVSANRYSEASRAYALAEIGRMAAYLRRHNLMAQFYQEDEDGQR